MPADVIMPMLGMAQETGKVLRWLKQDGESVHKGEPLLEVETDKVTVEIEAPADGTLAGVRVPEGTEVPVGEVIALVLAEGESAPVADTEPRVVREVEAIAAAPTIEPVTMPSRKRGRLASPKARRAGAPGAPRRGRAAARGSAPSPWRRSAAPAGGGGWGPPPCPNGGPLP